MLSPVHPRVALHLKSGTDANPGLLRHGIFNVLLARFIPLKNTARSMSTSRTMTTTNSHWRTGNTVPGSPATSPEPVLFSPSVHPVRPFHSRQNNSVSNGQSVATFWFPALFPFKVRFDILGAQDQAHWLPDTWRDAVGLNQ